MTETEPKHYWPIVLWYHGALCNDGFFRQALSELLYGRAWGPVGNAVSDEGLERLIDEIVEKVRPRP